MRDGALLNVRLAAIESKIRGRATAPRADAWYQLHMATSRPPDTRIHVRPGWVQQGPYWIAQETIYYPALALDFGAVDQFSAGYTGNFDNAGWYIPALVMYDFAYFYALFNGTTAPPCLVYGGEPEYQTAAEAEQALDGWLAGHDVLYWGNLPMCGVILRNDSTTGQDGRVLPIDSVNRGRSYLWRDLRPRHNTLYYDGYYLPGPA